MWIIVVAVVALMLGGCAGAPATHVGTARISPGETGSLVVAVEAGTFPGVDGKPLPVRAGRVVIEPPETRRVTINEAAPRDYADWYAEYDPWPSSPPVPSPVKVPNYIGLTPKKDEVGTRILGHLPRALVPGSLVVTSADGKITFEAGKDYVVNEKWGLIAGINGRLGKPNEAMVTATATLALQRLDLLQADRAGRVSVKRGVSMLVCPELPEPDAGAVALAGIYVAPWQRAGKYAVTAEDIYPILPTAPVAPLGYGSLAKARAKLRRGEELRIAFMGDSITLGAEAGPWWADLWTEKNLGFASRVVVALRLAYPKATVTPISAFVGGITTGRAADLLEKSVLPAKPDVLLIAFGANDAAGPVGKPPTNPPEQHKKDVRAIVEKATAAGMEVIVVTPMQPSPWQASTIGTRIALYRQAQVELAAEEHVACADVYTEWMNQARQGVPPFSQLHNCINHPGVRGHALYADVILRLFK